MAGAIFAVFAGRRGSFAMDRDRLRLMDRDRTVA